jgi:UDP-glucose 4-epimerase
MQTSQRIALTGGRGRLAPGLAAHLVGAGHDVVLFSRQVSGPYRDLEELRKPDVLASFDVVLHLGWSTVPLVSEEKPGTEEKEDLPFVRDLVAAAAQCPTPPRIVFFSTAAVYGDTGDTPATEETPCAPLGRYAAAKLQAEELFASCNNACVLRITNVFGAGCPLTRPQGIIPVLLRAARSGGKVHIWGDGSAIKDYLAAPDLHRAVESALSSDLRGIFNVSSGCSLSVNDLVSLVEDSCGRKIEREYLPHYPWDVSKAEVSSAKLREAAGWKAAISPRDFVRQISD